MKISCIIPTRNRQAILRWHLEELNKQSLDRDLWEVIVVGDGDDLIEVIDIRVNYALDIVSKEHSGPAATRNYGAEISQGDIILFVGDDTIPTPHLLWRHYARHFAANKPIAVQGYIDWHPQIPPDDFMHFITGQGGQQFNWNNLRNSDGTWMSEAPGWFLTSNVSIDRAQFELENGFNPVFPDPAWEDIEFSVRLKRQGFPTFFEPDALNLHYHRITLDGFVQRQIMEGKSRWHLVALHTEFAGSFCDPAGMRDTNTDMLWEAVRRSKELYHAREEEVQETRLNRWGAALRLASLEGLRQGLETRSKAWQAIRHLHNGDAIRAAAGAAAALDRGDNSYAAIEIQWALDKEENSWPLQCLYGEVLIAMDDKENAIAAYQKSLELAPNEWANERLEELA